MSKYYIQANRANVWVPEVLANPGQPWIIEDFFPRAGLTIIAGRPKLSAKSWWALLAASCIASGKSYGPFKVMEKGAVLYIDKEASAYQAALRFEMLHTGGSGISYKDCGDFHYMQGMPFALDRGEHIGALCAYVAEHSIKYVFVDTFSRAFSGDENDSKDMMAALACFEPLRSLGCGLCIIHHSNKASYNQAGQRLDPDSILRGSSALAGAYEAILSIQGARVGGKHHNYLIRGGKYVTHEAYQFEWKFKKDSFAKLIWEGPMEIPEADAPPKRETGGGIY